MVAAGSDAEGNEGDSCRDRMRSDWFGGGGREDDDGHTRMLIHLCSCVFVSLGLAGAGSDQALVSVTLLCRYDDMIDAWGCADC